MIQQSRFLMRMVLKNERGAAAIEYGLLAALVAVALFAGAQILGTSLNNLFSDIAGFLTGVSPIGGGG
jgi:pilus assembly protein Flp/PilA